MAYKKDQGRYARLAAFWVLAVLTFYGCMSLHTYLSSWFGGTLGKSIGGYRIPVFGLDFSPALLITTVVLTGGIFMIYRWLERPKNADLLIETETELRKVTWPTQKEVVDSSIVVIFCVVFLMAFLAGADWFLGRVTQALLFGGS